jgi:hypothetical protein
MCDKTYFIHVHLLVLLHEFKYFTEYSDSIGVAEFCILCLESWGGFWWGSLRERDRWGDPGVGGKIILGWIFRKWNVGGMDWIGLAQDRDRWRAVVTAVLNLRV